MFSANKLRYFVLLTLCIIVTGCSTLNQEECLVADWQLIGREDGAEGRDAAYLGDHRKACAEYGIAPDLPEYKKGYDEGLNLYCDQYNGFKRGEQGTAYNGVCPAHLEPEFLAGYNNGRAIYLVKSRISHARSSITRNEREMKELDKQIVEIEDTLISDETTSNTRRKLLEDLKEKQEERGSLESKNQSLVIEAARLEGELKGMSYDGN